MPAVACAEVTAYQPRVPEYLAKGPQTHLQTTAANLPPPFALESTTVLTEPTGWAIISDIDDVSSPHGLYN